MQKWNVEISPLELPMAQSNAKATYQGLFTADATHIMRRLSVSHFLVVLEST